MIFRSHIFTATIALLSAVSSIQAACTS
ncbi:hypothetical protein CABS01_13225 [Colletotrichum abscissum]|uniref:Uncharacterized protein n=1 Tax=Colletotrichum costaricense TaxID=1209916 RepID=A0AAI9YMQ2_9PEZI|nr:hypothetical protein CABS01_13225 [Colletotrichum abscissum]KAK1516926.1 hypothetical protein CCOS01_12475 [Colletotrichum costaricense]